MIMLCIATATLAMFIWSAILPFAFSDDYPILWMAISGQPSVQFGKSILDASQDGGRPFAGLLTQWFFSAAGSIDNLRFVRLIAILGIVALALLIHWALVRSRVKPIPAALVAVFMCSMPAFQVYASWTVIFSAPLAALAAGWASLLVVGAVHGPRNKVADRAVGATALLIAALLTYQPAAMFYWVFVAIAMVGARDDSRRAFRLARAHFAAGGAALALAFVVTRIAVHLSGRAGRATLVQDVVGKASWFLHFVLYRSLNLFDLTPSRTFAALVVVVAAGGIGLWLFTRASHSFLYVAVGLALVPLSFLPNLVVEENSPTFRVQAALTSLIALYACLGVMGIWITARDWLRTRVTRQTLVAVERLTLGVSVGIVTLSAFFAAKNVITLFAEPQMTELRMLRSQVATLPSPLSRVGFVQTGYTQGMTKLALVGEFGVPTSVQPYNLEPSVYLVLHEEGRLPTHGAYPTVDIYPSYTPTLPKNERLIDLRSLQDLR
jgi:hypothetical protein